MALNSFGGAPGDVTSDSDGSVMGGVALKVYTAPLGGQRVTEIYDMTGAPLAGVVISGVAGEDEGRVAFQASDQYSVLYLDAGYGMRWAVPAREAFAASSTALSKSDEALTVAHEAKTVAAESGVKADQAKAEVAEKLGFDITELSPQFVTQLRIPPNRVMQAAARNPMNGDYYVSQSGPAIGSSTDLIISRCGSDGELLSQCIFEGGGHGSTVAIENDGQDVWLWFRWTYDSTGGAFTNRMVRAKYQPGKTVLRNDPEVLEVTDFYDNSLVDFSIDQSADRIASRIYVSKTEERFVLRRFSDYKNGVDDVLYSFSSADSVPGVDPYQGHVSIDDYVYVARGGSVFGTPNSITRYEWATGDSVRISIEGVGERAGGGFSGDYNEVEGISMWRGPAGVPALMFGKAVGAPGKRQALLFAFNAPAGPDVAGAGLRTLTTMVQAGKVAVPGTTGGGTTSREVPFKWEFPGVPSIVVSANTTAPGDPVIGVGFAGESSTGFTAYVTRTTATATTVSWIAYYGPSTNDPIL